MNAKEITHFLRVCAFLTESFFKVWEDRFDDVILSDSKLLNIKLNYIHMNPMQEHWNLVSKPGDYKYSSARFYESGMLSEVNVCHYKDYF